MENELEYILKTSNKAKMISYLLTHPKKIDEAIKLAISDKQPYSKRAAWLLWSCIKKNDIRIHKYINKIVNTLKNKEDDHQRELLKILLLMQLNEKYEGFVYNLCISIWEKINKKPSVRFTAFKFIVKIAKKHPELSQEISLLTQSHYLDSLSSAANKSILKMIKELSI